jgi:tRNA modification GTPase
VIAGKPNAGKSTLLNALLNEERAIVSDVEGTTRDTIEEVIAINGVQFRMIDTAGLREQTSDTIEQIGIGRTLESIKKARLVLLLFDVNQSDEEALLKQMAQIRQEGGAVLAVGNKADDAGALDGLRMRFASLDPLVLISAKAGRVDELLHALEQMAAQLNEQSSLAVTNSRHYQALVKASESLERALNGLDTGISGDFLAMDIRQALHHLAEITGEISSDDLLGAIFSRFCIGK